MIRVHLKTFSNNLYFIAVLTWCSCFSGNTVDRQNLKPNSRKLWGFKDTILQNQKMREWIIDSALAFKDSLMTWNPDLKILREGVDIDSSGYSFMAKLSNNVNNTNGLKSKDAILANLMEILKFNEIKITPPFIVDAKCNIYLYVENGSIYVNYVYSDVLVTLLKCNKKYNISIVKTNVTNIDTL